MDSAQSQNSYEARLARSRATHAALVAEHGPGPEGRTCRDCRNCVVRSDGGRPKRICLKTPLVNGHQQRLARTLWFVKLPACGAFREHV